MRKILAGLIFSALACFAIPATAQTSSAVVVSACGTPPASYPAGSNRQITQDTTGKLCDSGGGGGGGGGTVTPTNSAGAYSAATVGTSASTAITATSCKVFCEIVNDSPTATICISVGGTAVISGTTCAAGDITLLPLWHRSWEGFYVPSDAVSFIASAASTPAAVGAK